MTIRIEMLEALTPELDNGAVSEVRGEERGGGEITGEHEAGISDHRTSKKRRNRKGTMVSAQRMPASGKSSVEQQAISRHHKNRHRKEEGQSLQCVCLNVVRCQFLDLIGNRYIPVPIVGTI